ncbi:ribonuclease PH [Planctellipticum variicoloris]|uniref:ribonuclease PH n=1 Tax=Planctellipticum variicoloris TaxID=3064265 RepID=UPI00301322C9|nr:ribonuclease PH [Planctomycetaceae bacterium SH412]
MRHDGRQADELRRIRVQRHFTGAAPGSVLIQAGRTTVLCTASVENALPPWKKVADPALATGWLTAEYSMLPGSTAPRKRREREKLDGRSSEIQRLIGRSLRAAVDFKALGARTITVDCDVLEADGGTRTLSITGGFIALCDAVATLRGELPPEQKVLCSSIAAVSVGVCAGEAVLDLDYIEDSQAEVDLNVVMTGTGEFIEVQGTAEGRPFSREKLQQQLDLAEIGIARLTRLQQDVLGAEWPFEIGAL